MPGDVAHFFQSVDAILDYKFDTVMSFFFFFQAEDGIRDYKVTGVQTCALPISTHIASFGVTLLEAMACGTPMVVADNHGYRSVVDGGAEALIVSKDDPKIWAESAIALLGDPARRAAMGRAGLEKAARFAWPRIARAELAVYERVLAARAKGRSASAAASSASEPRYVRTPRKTSVIASTSR